jgi:hypothetical protein
MSLLAGIAFLSVDGTPYDVVGEAGYRVSGVDRKTKAGMDRVHGFAETPVPGHIVVKLRDSGTLTVADFNAMRSVTVVLQLANGKTVMASDAWTVDTQDVESEEATLPVKWESATVTEI